MAISRNLSFFVLLAQLASFSTEKIEGDFKKNLSNASTILIEDKLNEGSGKLLENVISLKSFDNISIALETTTTLSELIEEEKKIEAELKNVLQAAASSGQLIMLSSSQAEKSNSSKIIPDPLIIIKNLSTTSQSPIGQSRSIDDQEIAQSQIRTRTKPRHYEDHEDIENIEDLLAIAEYEPQKLDALRDEITSTETSIVESTSHRPPEEMHYDVPRRRNLPATPKRERTQVRWSTTPKTYLDDLPTQLTSTESSEDSIEHQKDQTASRLQLPEYSYKANRRKSSSPLTSREKLLNSQEKWLRGPRHLKPILLSSRPDPLPIVVPRISESDLKYPKVNGSHLENVTNVSESARRKFRPSTRTTSPATLPLTYPTIGPNQIVIAPQRKYHEPHAMTLTQPRPVNRRNDDYLDYGTPEIHSAPNDSQRGPLNRYNLLSPITKRLPNPYTYSPIPIPTNQPNIPAKNIEEESVESDSREKKADYDYYEESKEQRQSSESKPYPVDYSEKETRNTKTIPAYDSYEDNVDPKSSKLYENGAEPLPNSAEPDYESYETDEVTPEPQISSNQSKLHPGAKKLQSVAANRFINVPTKPINYGHLVSTVSPVGRTNFLSTPVYPYQNVYLNPKAVVPNVRKIEKRPGAVTKHPQNFYQPKKAYEPYEDSEDRTTSLGVIREPARNQNDVEDRYIHSENAKNNRLTKGIKPNRDDWVYSKENDNDYRPQLKHTLDPSASPQETPFNPQSTFVTPVKLSNPTHTKSSPIINGYIANDYNIYSPTSSAQRVQVESSDEQNGGEVADYDLYDSRKPINVSPVVTTPRLKSEKSAHYGSRVRPLKVSEQQKTLPPLPPTHQTTSSNLPIERSQRPRIFPVRNYVEPAESVHRLNSLHDSQDYEDEVPASSGHQENHEPHAESRKDEGGDEESEKGGGEKHEEAHHNSSGEKAEKNYKEWHEYDKGKKGHHDKEHHDNEYHEEKGDKKKHEEESGYHKEHHHGEKGSKESEFGEKGEHEKGHSTKGEHVVHKKDEYEKKTEFYDESHEEDGDEKEGEYHYEHEDKKGGHEKIGHHDSAYHVDKYGKKGEHEKGQHWHEKKGHEKKDGREQDHSHEEKYGKKGAHEEGEKWSHKKGDKEQR